ncbi:hypothetical protein [Paraburkholderia aspalathi]|uniref:Uncharacterized protein n=1 Tax=Paraburkholderia aspalathi TaxID=1324617 RepID=A0A1I7A9H0_9BURK|nr:hypothetical protein [Paraburkholderia aspalathi]SFT71566.1 hypothetical protein SAMN05192563_1003196 [Paraburkholderia aspalathi]HEV2680823.1 hypothetical protein [Rhodanobacter sp.]
MGWLFLRQSRHELIQQLIEPTDNGPLRSNVIAHALRGNVLWSVVHVTDQGDGALPGLTHDDGYCYIRCDLLQRSGDQWGYKPMDESMHPYYYSCPLSYLAMAPEQSAEWREGVRAYHARRRTPMASTTTPMA